LYNVSLPVCTLSVVITQFVCRIITFASVISMQKTTAINYKN